MGPLAQSHSPTGSRILAEYELSRNQLARAIGISPNRIADIVNNRRRITAGTALRH